MVNGKIIGSVRGCTRADTAYISRLIVHPYFQKRGIGQQLVREIELALAARRFEVFTGSKSERNLRQFHKLGYEEFKTEQFTPQITWVYMQKNSP